MRLIALHLSLILLFSGGMASAQVNLSQALPTDPNVKIGKLSNGLTYYIRHNAKPEKKVELRLVVNAGSILEDEDQLGLAHFMEHMGFNGTKNFKKNELVDYLQKSGVQFGADLNAYTGFDETVYILPIPSNDFKSLDKGLTVLEDWAFHNLMDKNEIEKERGVVLEESRLSKGAEERMSRQYFPRLFNGSKYATRLPIGTDSSLKNFKPEALKRFYKEWYRPDLMAVIVVGDVNVAEAEKLVKGHFGKAPLLGRARYRPSIIPVNTWTKPEAMVLTDEEATHTILQIFNYIKPAKKIKTWGDYRKNVAEELVTSLINLRLQELSQKPNPPFMVAFSGMTPLVRGYQSFVSFAILTDENTAGAVEALVTETRKVQQFGFLKTELERAKAQLLTQAEKAYNERDKSESGAIIAQYVNHFLAGSPIPGPEKSYLFLKEVLPGITLEDVNGVVKEFPSTANAFALVTAPEKIKGKLPTNEALLNSIVAASQKAVTAYEEKAVASALLDRQPEAGKVVQETKNEKLGTTTFTMSNGITITLKPTTLKNDQIVMKAKRLGGYHNFPLADKLAAQNSASLVTQMGVKDFTPTELRKFLAGKSVSVKPLINEHDEGITGSSSVKDFETFLQLAHLYFTQPRQDEGLFQAYVKKEKGKIQYQKQDPTMFFIDSVMKMLYANHPWADAFPTPEEFDQLNPGRSIEIYRQVFGNAYGMHFTFVGNIDPATARPLLERYLGSLPSKPREIGAKDNMLRPVKGVVNTQVKRGKAQQSFITLFFTGETPYTYKEELALQALMEAMNIKVVETLREEMSSLYGGQFFADLEKHPYMNYMVGAFIPCGPENVEKITATLDQMIATAREKGLAQGDLDKVKETWKKQHEKQVQDNEYWLESLSKAFRDGEDPANVLNYQKDVESLTLEDLRKAAVKFLNPANSIKAVLYPEAFKAGDEKKAF
jgi:zinc protease